MDGEGLLGALARDQLAEDGAGGSLINFMPLGPRQVLGLGRNISLPVQFTLTIAANWLACGVSATVNTGFLRAA